MARIRTIKPDFFTDEKITEISRDARLLFIGLLVFADDMGRMQYSPGRLKNQIFPGDDITDEAVERWTEELAEIELVKPYSVHKQRCLWIPGFLRHQKINRPSHSDLPAHPRDYRPDCRCAICQGKVEHSKANGRYARVSDEFNRDVPAGTHGISESLNHGIQNSPPEVGSRKYEVGVSQNQHQGQNQNQSTEASNLDPSSASDLSQENRRTERRAVEEIAARILGLLHVAPNQLILEALMRSIEVKARTRSCSLELAAQQILAQAALVASEAPPENWLQWFEDVRYLYVPEGDPRLKDRRLEARPVCGGKRCSDGWETVKVNGLDVLRRCSDCARLWSDLGEQV